MTWPHVMDGGGWDTRLAKTLDVRSSVVVPDKGHSVHRKAGPEVASAIRAFVAGLSD